ncbi:MAG: DapH/DapD/GlmU-related protein [Methanobacterium sp.]|jgi:acetyltransferase-like isoleucine patch superfamily enzyme
MPFLKNILGSGNIPKFRNILGPDTKISGNPRIQENVTIGVKYKIRSKSPIIGENALIRSNTVIYDDVNIGNDFRSGHGVVIREKTRIGNNVLIGTNSVIEGNCDIGNDVSIQSNVYIPTNMLIEDYVFIGPCACFTNDRYPIRIDFDLKGPTIRKGASIGANSTFLSDLEIGEGAMIAAGAIVTRDVPPFYLAIGAPARLKPLPKHLMVQNKI